MRSFTLRQKLKKNYLVRRNNKKQKLKAKIIFEKTGTKKSLKHSFHIQGAQKAFSRIILKRSILRHILAKVPKAKANES